jgi:hypothetical protein
MDRFFKWGIIFIVAVIVIACVLLGVIAQQEPYKSMTVGEAVHLMSKDLGSLNEELQITEEDYKLFQKQLEKEVKSKKLDETGKQRIKKLLRKINRKLEEINRIIEESHSK